MPRVGLGGKVDGPLLVSVNVAARLGALLGREARIVGEEASDALLADTSLAARLFGPPEVDAETLVAWVAAWVRAGGRRLGKPTGFEVRDGRF